MGKPARTVGLPYHILYPVISAILLGISSFTSASTIWYASATTQTEMVRFGTTNYCGYNMSNFVITADLGCINRGWQWQIPQEYFGFDLPGDINYNLSKVVVTSAVAFGIVLASSTWHAYTIRYSFRLDPEPSKDKLWSCVQIHIVTVTVCFLFTWIAFIAQAAVIGHAASFSQNITSEDGVSVSWGQGPWLVLGAAIVHFAWGWEAVRWRASLLA